MSCFRSIARDTEFLFPPSVQDWLPESHLARYVVEVVEQLDLSALEEAYAGRGKQAYHPAVLLALLIYGYATGTYSSRKIERATYDSVAFRYIAANQHPDHDTIAHFRKRFGAEFQAVFLQVLQIARVNQLSKFGTVSLDGTKVRANASRHRALSYGRAQQIEAQLKGEIEEMLALAEAADHDQIPDGVDLPAEIERREDRLAAIAAAKAEIEARARERAEHEQLEYQEKLRKRAEKEARGGKTRGRIPKPPRGPQPQAQDQVNLTDAESRIMPVRGKAFDQCYNAQAAVDTESMLIVAVGVSDCANDKRQVKPMLEALARQGEDALPERLLADTGYYSEENVKACEAAGVDALIAMGRSGHHPNWRERFTQPQPPDENATTAELMAYRLRTLVGRALYALRKQTVEPVFGIMKSVMGLRQFSVRGLARVNDEWTLASVAWNVKRMGAMQGWSVRWT